MKFLIMFLLPFLLFTITGCATVERFIDDIYDGDERMTEIKQDVDALKNKLKSVKQDAQTELAARLNILREEAEMLGDLKKQEFLIKYSEIKNNLQAVKSLIERRQK